MISIGNFVFPEKRTVVRTLLAEAKSKVRKQIRIQSLLRASSLSSLDSQLAVLQEAMESLDRDRASLSLREGRYYQGRRRDLLVTPVPGKPFAWIDLTVFTRDRYERGKSVCRLDQTSVHGRAFFSVFSHGNWSSPLELEITPEQPIASVRVITATHNFLVQAPLAAGRKLCIDSIERTVGADGVNLYSACNEEFPRIGPGSGHVTVRTEPVSARVDCVLYFQEHWI